MNKHIVKHIVLPYGNMDKHMFVFGALYQSEVISPDY